MSIRFKFRSSVSYDTVDIDGRSSISVRELRLKIIRRKSINICQDFDLVFSDAVSGQEYDDENFPIPSGSSVIIKRVPAGTGRCAAVPIDAAGDFGVKGLYTTNLAIDQMEKFDEFGADLYPIHVPIPHLEMEYGQKTLGGGEKANFIGLRSECDKVHPGGSKGNIAVNERADEQMKLEKLCYTDTAAVQNMGLPSELKCSLCKTYFKDAVMIPCCQHSFCDKCIRKVLVEKARCPKCLSDKCNVENLLPNLSLRHAIEHFLESQNLQDASENAFNRYAPDGESGIQAKDDVCTITVIQREPELPHSPTATGKGSNIILSESFYDSNLKRNPSLVPSDYGLAAGRGSLAPKMQKVKDFGGKPGIYEPNDVDSAADFQGENNLHQNNVCDEADSTRNRNRETWVNSGGGDRSFPATGRLHKGNRTCYMCGSPEHLMRDCPLSSCPQPMLPTGPDLLQGGIARYASPYWNSAAYPPFRPFANMYGNPAMMAFNASIAPVTYRAPPYAPNMYGGLPTGGILRVGNLLAPRAEYPLAHSDVELHDADKKRKLSNGYLGRGRMDDGGDDFSGRNAYGKPERSHEYRVYKEREASGNHSEDKLVRKAGKKNHPGQHGDSDRYSLEGDFHEKTSRSSISGRDRKSYPSERSGPGVENTNTIEHGKEGSKGHHRSSKRHHEERQQQRSCSDSSWGQHHHQSGKEAAVRCRIDSDTRASHKKHDHYYKESHLETKSSDNRRRRNRDSVLEVRHSRHDSKRKYGHPHDDRWRMVSCSDEEAREEEDYHLRKHKRVH